MPHEPSGRAAASSPPVSLREVVGKAIVVHTATYFLVGLAAFVALDYSTWFADPRVAAYMRQTDEPIVMAGPLFQPLRGALFGLMCFVLRDSLFRRRSGWAALWCTLLVAGILSPFGPTPSSIEGMVYTTWPLAWHLRGLPEIVIQSGLLAWLLHAWVTGALGRAVRVILGLVFAAAILLPVLGLVAGR